MVSPLLLLACAPKDSSEPTPSGFVDEPITAPVAVAEPEPPPEPEPEPLPPDDPLVIEVDPGDLETRVAKRALPVYRQPKSSSRRRATLKKGATFAVKASAEGSGCGGDGWAEIPGEGFVCLLHTEPTEEPLLMLPSLVEFIHPAPSDWETYSTEGLYDDDLTSREVRGLVPFVYAKVWRQWKGMAYSSAEAYERGASPVKRMEYGRKFHFTEAIETERGTVLSRSDGTVIPLDDIFLYPISYFKGRELELNPVGADMLAAWVFGYDGAGVRAEPSMDAEIALTLPYHQALEVKDAPVDDRGNWWEIPDALGPGVSGYVHDQVDIRHWVPRDRPVEVGPDEVWVDVDLGQQVLAMRKGDDTTFITLVSTGDVGWSTPEGIFRIYDKMIDTDMRSRDDADPEDVYHVEKVPWTMHFKPRYALHGVFWHWGFGHRASHGCVNLAPRDARYVFDRVGPTLEAGWHSVYETPDDAGTLMRVRKGSNSVNDRRASLR
ncbi:MAG: lipoprotein-anchoring transpeptidase ErfK/SrfK [Myxococcota bacterium]|jgi:lipoprotein-anchoring transpeptidase ErfK/SrfK